MSVYGVNDLREFSVVTVLMTTLSWSEFSFCHALDTGHMKDYRDESVRLQLVHLVHLA